MQKILKNKREIILWTAAFLLSAFVTGYTIYAISFLSKAADSILSRDAFQKPAVLKFDFEKLGKLLSSGRFPESVVR